MDNLGVSMNATTIEAYALSKGIDTSYASMDNAQKIGLAMEMFMENTAYAAGNYAKENETLAGSLGTAQAALTNFLSGAGDADQLVNAVTNTINVISNNLQDLLPRLTTGLTSVVQGLIPQIPPLLKTLLPSVIEGASTLINGVVSELPNLLSVIIDALPMVIEAILTLLPLLADAGVKIVTKLISGIAKTLPKLIPAAVDAIMMIIEGLIDNLPLLLEAAIELVEGLATGIINAIPVLVEKLPKIIDSIVSFLTESLPVLIQSGVDLFTSLIEDMPTIINTILNVLPKLIESLVEAILGNISMMINAGIQLFVALIEALPEIIQGIVSVLPQIIKAIVNAFIDNIDSLINVGVQLFIALIENLPTIITEIVKAAPQIIDALVSGFISLFPKIEEVGNNLIRGIWTGIDNAGEWLKNKISGFFGGVVDNIKSFFGIASPSKLFEKEIGAMLPAGMAEGIEKNSSKATNAAEEMARDTYGKINNELHAMTPSTTKEISTLNQITTSELDKTQALWKEKYSLIRTTSISELQELQKDTENEINILNRMSAKELDKLKMLWFEKHALARKMSINELKKLREEALNEIMGMLADLSSIINVATFPIGENMIQGIIDGISSKSENLLSTIQDLMKAVVEKASKTLEIKSPSKKFEELGIFTGQGFIDGVVGMERAVVKTVDNIFGGLSSNKVIDIPNISTNMDATRGLRANTLIQPSSPPITINQYFYGVREEKTAFEAYRATQKASEVVFV